MQMNASTVVATVLSLSLKIGVPQRWHGHNFRLYCISISPADLSCGALNVDEAMVSKPFCSFSYRSICIIPVIGFRYNQSSA